MRQSRQRALLSLFFTLGALAGLVVAAPPAFAATIIVNSTADNQADDGVCTLREAIIAANNDMASGTTPGECPAGSGADLVSFDISGAGPHTITPGSAPPSITAPVTIDGYTQTGASVNTAATGTNAVIMIEIDGSTAMGFGLVADDGTGATVIRGLAVTGFANGILLGLGGADTVEGTFIGVHPDGTTAAGNANGILIGNSPNNTVGGTSNAARNLISGNTTGIRINNNLSTGNTIAGNLIGTDRTGDVDLGNSSAGVILDADPDNNVIGGTTAGAGNVISGNNSAGVSVTGSGTTGNQIQGNLIGTNATGTVGLPNGQAGVNVNIGADGTQIGGTDAGARNVISGNAGDGVFVSGGATNTVVHGNYIGLDVTGATALPNVQSGIEIITATGTVIGGTTGGDGNVISGNTGSGIEFTGSSATMTTVQGNYIGTDATGELVLPNVNGIRLNSADDNQIGGIVGTTVGGPCTGACNLISGNSASGVATATGNANDNVIEGNFIGTDKDGVTDLGNAMHGVFVGDSTGNRIGGTTSAARNVISGNDSNGVFITGDVLATGNEVQGNFIGTSATGDVSLPNGLNGVFILGAAGTTVGGTAAGAGNVISGNSFDGVRIFGADAAGSVVQGNRIGTNAAGAAAVPNGTAGVGVSSSGGAVVGGTTAQARNVISGNTGAGVSILSGAGGHQVLGNFIGTNLAGTADLGNGQQGVLINASPDNIIGGTAPGAGNLISGNGFAAIGTANVLTTGTIIQGNLIGTNAAGTGAIANDVGITIDSNTTDTLIGGTVPGAGNVISGNTFRGITMQNDVSETVVQGNLIGTDLGGTAPLGNVGGGIRISQGAHDNTVGGTAEGAGNTIANNGGRGIEVFTNTTQDNSILGNSIHDNAALGIDLGTDIGPDGVTPNDVGDGDSGPNDLQNFPLITAAISGSTVVEGTLNSVANTAFRLEFFASPACDLSGHGEGETFLGSTDVTTNPSGNASFSEALAETAGVGGQLTATATRLVAGEPTDTSEFSECVEIRVADADLQVTKSDSADPVTVGDVFTYTVAVANGGPDPALDVVLTDELPPQVAFSSSNLGSPTCVHDGASTGGTVTCDLGMISSGETVSVQVRVTAVAAGTVTNTAQVGGAFTDPVQANNTALEQTVIEDPKCPGLEDVPGDHIVGTPGPDELTGTPEVDVICGLGGNDTIRGLGGNDLLDGGPGNDKLVGGAGADTLLGRAGNDTIKGKNGKDLAKGGGGKDRVRGGGGKDTLRGQAKDDDLKGQGGNDRLFGNAGDDSLNGGPGEADLCRQGSGSGPLKGCER